MEAVVCGTENVCSTKHRQFQVRLNSSRQAATTWADADRPKAIDPLERDLHQVTPATRKLFDKVLQHHARQVLQEVGTMATGPSSTFAKQLGLMKTAPKY
jgi:hypothetical protein